MRDKFYFKSMGVIFGINIIVYFGIKLFISNYNLIAIPFDNKIPFLPEFIYFYMLWYPFLFLSFYYIFKKDKNSYINLIMTTAVSLLVLYICFIVFPTRVIRPNINKINSVTMFMVNFVYKTDYPVNCFPSGHCLLCFILLFNTIKCKDLNPWIKIFIIIFNLIIIESTVLVKQHVIVDIFGSLILSSIVYLLVTQTKCFNPIKLGLKKEINK